MDGHLGVTGQEIVHQAFEIGGEMLDDYKRHAAVSGHVVEKLLDGGKPACRGTNADDEARCRNPRSPLRDRIFSVLFHGPPTMQENSWQLFYENDNQFYPDCQSMELRRVMPEWSGCQ